METRNYAVEIRTEKMVEGAKAVGFWTSDDESWWTAVVHVLKSVEMDTDMRRV